MLRVSKLADYATLVMSYLAQNPARHANASEIAEATKLRVTTVRKVLKLLTSKQLLTSIQGSKGGYSLARSSQEISLAQIIAAIDQQEGLTECSSDHSNCTLEQQCLVRSHWQVIDRTIHAVFDSVMLADLLSPACDVTPIDISAIRKRVLATQSALGA